MEIFTNLALGFSVALSPFNLLMCLIGVMFGTLIGVLPGVGPVATIVMLLPITFNLNPIAALIIFSVLVFVKGLTLPFPICPSMIEDFCRF